MASIEDIPTHEVPASAARIARRSLVLAAVICCSAINNDVGQADAENLHKDVLDWLTKLNLWDEVEPSEEKILHTPLWALEAGEADHITWYAEGLAVLAWALNRLELPRHDEQINPHTVASAVGFLSEDAEEMIDRARLRSGPELDAYRELIYAIHSRLRDYARNRQKANFTTWIDKAWIDILKIDVFHLIIQDDLAINGKAIAEAENYHRQDCEWITRERHRAIVWLVENRPSYSQTSADT